MESCAGVITYGRVETRTEDWERRFAKNHRCRAALTPPGLSGQGAGRSATHKPLCSTLISCGQLWLHCHLNQATRERTESRRFRCLQRVKRLRSQSDKNSSHQKYLLPIYDRLHPHICTAVSIVHESVINWQLLLHTDGFWWELRSYKGRLRLKSNVWTDDLSLQNPTRAGSFTDGCKVDSDCCFQVSYIIKTTTFHICWET